MVLPFVNISSLTSTPLTSFRIAAPLAAWSRLV
jgi:hypothetical protein